MLGALPACGLCLCVPCAASAVHTPALLPVVGHPAIPAASPRPRSPGGSQFGVELPVHLQILAPTYTHEVKRIEDDAVA